MTTTQPSSAEKTEPRPQQQLLHFALAAVILSQGLHISGGFFNLDALCALTFSFFFCMTAVARLYFPISEQHCERWTLGVMISGIVVQFGQLLTRSPDVNIALLYTDYLLYLLGVAFAGILAIAIVIFRPEFRRFGFPILLVTHFLLGVWIIRHSPNPQIDVFVVQRDAAKALLSGINPYTITFPNIYEDSTPYYRQELVVAGRLMFGYVYPPLCLLLAIPGYLLGDVRYSNLIAITLGAALLAYARPSRLSFLAAILFLFMPRVFFILANCWTESFVVLLFALVLFIACRKPRLTPIAFGLLLAVKQHLFLCIPLATLICSRGQRRKDVSSFLMRAVLVSLAVSLPLILWNTQAFIDYAVLMMFGQLFRTTSLNYAVFWALSTGQVPSTLIGFLILLPIYVLILHRSLRTPAGFAGSVALLYFAFFLFGRQAFINYYYFVFAALCGAVATFSLSTNTESVATPSSTDGLENTHRKA